MKTRRFDFNFAPLRISHGLLVSGSIPSQQSYNADEDEYTPDYRLTPLVVQPFVNIMDTDGVLAAGSINSELTNMVWTEYDGNKVTAIDTSNTDYTITTSGTEKGKLIMRRNANDGVPITLEFTAEYYDTRTKQVTSIRDTLLVICKNASPEVPTLTLTAPDTSVYNPLRDDDTQKVVAQLFLGKKEVQTANRLFVWDIYREGEWSEVGSHPMDYFIEVSDDTTTVTLDKRIMGAGVSLRCRAKYSNQGVPDTVELGADSPTEIVNFVRRIGKLDYDITGVPYNLPSGLTTMYPLLSVRDASGLIENPEKELLPLWYIATNKASGTLVYTQVGHGYTPAVATSALDNEYGAVLAVDLRDQGGFRTLVDKDGVPFTDAEGKLILIK
jgi:hypothetical protein